MSDTLPVLPEVTFLETDPQEIIDDIIAGYELVAGITLSEADPRRLYLLSIAYIIIQQRQKIESSAKSNLLYYAQDDFLDHIGALRNTLRIEAQPAVTSFRFTLSSVQATNIGIPQGTRATADNQLYWHTTAPATIVAGNSYVDVPGEALTAGEIGNGLAVGQINRIVDPIPYVQTVSNRFETFDGREAEGNASYRERIYQAPVGFSIAGPRDAYIFHALGVSSGIVDVSAYSPSAGVVQIHPLLENGGIPGTALLDEVEAALSPNTIRPLTDLVQVSAPTVVNYNIELTYYVRSVDNASVPDIQARVDEAVQNYISWQHGKIGRDVTPDVLISGIIQAGAKRSVISSPSYEALDESEVAVVNAVTVTYGGLEDD